MSERDIRAWGVTAEKAGLSSEAITSGLKNFRKTTDEMKYHIGGARDELPWIGAGPVVQRLEHAATMGERLKVAFDFKEVLEKNDPTGFKARMFFDQIGLGADNARLSLADYNAERAKMKPTAAEDIANAKKFKDAMIDLEKAWNGLLKKTGVEMFPGVTKAIIGLDHLLDKIIAIDDAWAKFVGKGTLLATDPGIRQDDRCRSRRPPPDFGDRFPGADAFKPGQSRQRRVVAARAARSWTRRGRLSPDRVSSRR